MSKLLIVVDMQNDFIDGSLGTPEAQAIVGKVAEKIRTYEAGNNEVIFTMDTHYEDYLGTSEGRKLPVKHCIYGTEGWKLSTALAADNQRCVIKNTFGWMQWQSTIQKYGIEPEEIESIELVGLCTDICVVSNALILKALFPEIPILVDAGCCAGVTPKSHQAALETMKMCQIDVIEN